MPELIQLARSKLTGMCASQAAEDIFNHMKNHRSVKNKKKYRRVEKCMAAAVSRRVLSTVHDYREPALDCAPPRMSVKLPAATWRAAPTASSLPFSHLVSPSASVPWHSPGAANWSLSAADLALLRDTAASSQYDMLGGAWLSAVVKPKHQLLLKFPDGDQWFFAVHGFADSSVLLLPACEGRLPGGGAFWVPDLQTSEPHLKPLFTLAGISALCYEWKAPSAQVKMCAAASGMKPAIRAFDALGIGPASLQECAARMAFWNMEKSTLGMLAKYWGMTVPVGSSLFETVWSLVKFSLPHLDEAQLLSVMQRRVAQLEYNSLFSQELLAVDEAVEVLDKSDEHRIRQEQHTCREHNIQREAFKTECHKRAAEVREKQTTVAKKNKHKNSVASGSSSGGYPARIPKWPPNNIPLVEAKRLAPEGSSLWSSLQHGNWQGHYPPYPRCSRSWQRYGEYRALMLVLQHLWRWKLWDQGLSPKDCPIAGVFDEGEPEGLSGGASSSRTT